MEENGIKEERNLNYWESAVQHVEQYVTTKLKLYKFELVERLTLIGSSLISSLFICIFILFCFIFLLLGGAYAIGEYTGHIYLGFLFVAGSLLLFAIIFYAFKRQIKKIFLNILIRKAFEDER